MKVRYSYKDVAEEVFGKRFGGKIINAATSDLVILDYG